MTLDEAIKNEEDIAIQQIERANALDNIPLFGMSKDDIEEIKECYKCSKEHEQLAEYLKELKVQREALQKMKNHIKSLSNDPVFGVKPHLSISEKEWNKDAYLCGFIDVVDIIERYLPELDIYDKRGGAE